jgi:hypothetical protein
MGAVRAMIEAQQEQNALLREGLTAALEKATAPREQRTGNVTDFMRMNPAVFTGTEIPLEAEQWITDMENILKTTKIPEADQVEVITIRLTDIARIWWLAYEACLTTPISWK